MILRQAAEIDGLLSFAFYIKVSSDSESPPSPVQSHDYTGVAGLDNVPDYLIVLPAVLGLICGP